jgi:Protein of unknown function (DUF1045)
MHPRYAIYYTPPPSSRLASFAAGVIGYDSCEAVEVRFAELPGIDSHVQKLMTIDPRRYGFHATLVAPFYLRERSQEEQLIAAANDFASMTPPARIGSLTVAVLDDFIALVPVGSDRGEIVIGRRADLIRVRVVHNVPVVRSVWRGGRRVA